MYIQFKQRRWKRLWIGWRTPRQENLCRGKAPWLKMNITIFKTFLQMSFKTLWGPLLAPLLKSRIRYGSGMILVDFFFHSQNVLFPLKINGPVSEMSGPEECCPAWLISQSHPPWFRYNLHYNNLQHKLPFSIVQRYQESHARHKQNATDDSCIRSMRNPHE